LIRVISLFGFSARVFKAIESQIWENVIPTVVTICMLRLLMEAAGKEIFTLEKGVFEDGDLKNSFGDAAE